MRFVSALVVVFALSGHARAQDPEVLESDDQRCWRRCEASGPRSDVEWQQLRGPGATVFEQGT